MAEPCGCRVDVRVTDDDEGFTTTSSITYCPMHAAAGERLAALKRIAQAKCYCHYHFADDYDCPHEIAEKAAAARGGGAQ